MENECRHFANIAINVEGSGTGIVPEGEGGGEGEGRPVLKRAILGGGGRKDLSRKHCMVIVVSLLPLSVPRWQHDKECSVRLAPICISSSVAVQLLHVVSLVLSCGLWRGLSSDT